MLDFVEPDKRYSVAEYKKQAIKAIRQVIDKKKIPIVVRRNRTIHKFSNLWDRLSRYKDRFRI